MRRLTLLRHAKSSWDQGDLDDASRPLAPRGRRAAPLIGRYISSHDLIPDLVLCSSAERARQTLELVRAEWDRSGSASDFKVETRAALYLATPGEMMAMLRRLGNDVSAVMLIGHNPGMEVLAKRLAAKGDSKIIDMMTAKFPTAALAVLDLDIGRWKSLEVGCGHLRSFIRPKDLA
jgi:phosphohistidine phosphatase